MSAQIQLQTDIIQETVKILGPILLKEDGSKLIKNGALTIQLGSEDSESSDNTGNLPDIKLCLGQAAIEGNQLKLPVKVGKAPFVATLSIENGTLELDLGVGL
ncbi:MAG: hypothetical protein AAF585_10745 [Verrucomicrobiota bacterium]